MLGEHFLCLASTSFSGGNGYHMAELLKGKMGPWGHRKYQRKTVIGNSLKLSPTSLAITIIVITLIISDKLISRLFD